MVYIVNKAFLLGKVARWMFVVQDFDFAIHHTLGQADVVADFLSRLKNNELSKELYDELPDASLFSITQPGEGEWYENMINFLLGYQFPSRWSKDKRRQLALKNRKFIVIDG